VARPLIDLRLFRSRGFRAATVTTFLLAGALFGTPLILPLYYQVDRGESALNAGLLLAPQGLGAAAMLPVSGRLTDRVGGGPVAVAGCSLVVLATVPLVFVSGHTSFGLLAPLSASERSQIGEPLAAAFGHTMVWSVGMSLLALLAAVSLLRAERRRSRGSVHAEITDRKMEVPGTGPAYGPRPRPAKRSVAQRAA
jgi:MFS family permease